MRVLTPFPPDELDAPAGFELTHGDATAEWPVVAAEQAQFYVPAYRFDLRVVEVMRDMPALESVQLLTAGFEHALPYLPEGVRLANGAGIHDAATAELAVGLMIGAQRRLADLARSQPQGVWDNQMTSSLADRRVLVVGAGNIARALRRRLESHECEVTLVGRSARDGVQAISALPDLLPNADIVVLLVPLTETTRGLVDASFLAAMPAGALLVNVARGPVVVTDALLAETRTGRLRAALDVIDPEPLPADHPLWVTPGVTITPHVGGAASSMWPRARRLVNEQLRRLAAGEPLLHQVA